MAGENGNGKRSVSVPITVLVSLVSMVLGGAGGGFIAPVRDDARAWDRDKRVNDQEVKMERVLTEITYLRADVERLRQQLDNHVASAAREKMR